MQYGAGARAGPRAAAIADMRVLLHSELVAKTVVKPHESSDSCAQPPHRQILTGSFAHCHPAFIAIMGLVFFLTFNVIGLFFQNLMETGIDALTGIVTRRLQTGTLTRRCTPAHRRIDRCGSVLSFLPIIVVLFFFLSMLRILLHGLRGLVMDKLLRRIGLSGRTCPCSSASAARCPASWQAAPPFFGSDRKMTILLTPFMSCSAKLPIWLACLWRRSFPQYGL